MLAVDPDQQGSGIGTTLTEFALDRLKDDGVTVRWSKREETPDTPRHAYEKVGYVLSPVARYFKNL